ncbi:IS3 family transposase [Streptomyces olivoreticuli]
MSGAGSGNGSGCVWTPGRRVFAARAEANLAPFEYIDGFHNSWRIQERLDWFSPIGFEEKHYTKQVVVEPADLPPCQPSPTG